LISDKFKELLATQAVSLLSSGKLGFGGNSTSPSSTSLDVDSGVSASATAVKADDNTIEYSFSVAGSDSKINGKTMREAGFFTSSGDMLARVNFDGISVASTSDIEIYFVFEVE
jgi:hypothetical protein